MGDIDKRLILGAGLFILVVVTGLYLLGLFDGSSAVKTTVRAQADHASLPHAVQPTPGPREPPALPETPAAPATAPPAAGRDDVEILPNGVAMLVRIPPRPTHSDRLAGSVTPSNDAPADVELSSTGEMSLKAGSVAAMAAQRTKAQSLPPNPDAAEVEISPNGEATLKRSVAAATAGEPLAWPSAPGSGADDVDIGPGGVATPKRRSSQSPP